MHSVIHASTYRFCLFCGAKFTLSYWHSGPDGVHEKSHAYGIGGTAISQVDIS